MPKKANRNKVLADRIALENQVKANIRIDRIPFASYGVNTNL